MKSGALLPSNLPSIIDRSNLSPSRFIFISILIMTQLHPRAQKTVKRTDSRDGDSLKKNPSYNRLNGKAWLYIG